MKLNYSFFFILFITTLSFSQLKESVQAVLSYEQDINERIRKAIKLYKNYEYKKALIIVKQCVKESDSIQNDSLLGKSYIVNGIIDTYLNKNIDAINNHRKAEVVFAKTKNYKMVGLAYHNIAFAYNKENDNIDSALVYYKKAMDMYKLSGNTYKVAVTANNLGFNYFKIKEIQTSKEYLEEAIRIAEIHNINNVLCSANTTYGRIYYYNNNLQKALHHLNISQEIAEKENYKKVLVNVYELKNLIFKKLGDIKKAYRYLKKYNEFLNETHEIEKYRIIQEVAVKHEVKYNKDLFEKIKLKNIVKEHKINTSKQIIFFVIFLLIISMIISLILYKNNNLKVENNKLLLHKNEQLETLQQQTELNFLKVQIQPYFFFNTLDALYNLLNDKSKYAKDIVIKLSEIMQYNIYEAKNESVSIWAEIDTIKNYLELQRLYLKQKYTPFIKVNGDLDNIQIPPLLYFTLIENYFKSNNTNEDVEFSISFHNIGANHLLFNMSSTSEKEIIHNIDIEKTERKLKLLYKDMYSLKVKHTHNLFYLDLKIPLCQDNYTDYCL